MRLYTLRETWMQKVSAIVKKLKSYIPNRKSRERKNAYLQKEVWYAGFLYVSAKWCSLSWAGVIFVLVLLSFLVGYWRG